jgi:hypothetical protein
VSPGVRAAAIVATSAVLLAAVASPAHAVNDGEQPGAPMSPAQVLLIFVGIPVAFAALVWLLVSAPGWTRGGRVDATDAWTGDPLLLGADAPASRPAVEAATADGDDASTDTTGGTSARW